MACTESGYYLLQTFDNLFFYFGEVPNTNTKVPLQRIENVFGHFLHFTRTPDGTLTDISATGGTRVHLHYDHPLGRLTDIKRVVDNQAVETLTQYRYDEHGQLSAVRNRNGDSVRSFSYVEGVMTKHSNALGLLCEYRIRSMNPTFHQMGLRLTVASPASSSTAAALRSPLLTRHAATAQVRGAATYRAPGRWPSRSRPGCRSAHWQSHPWACH